MKNTFFNNKIKIKTTITTTKCESKYPPVSAGNNLESWGSIQKNKKRALGTVKGHFIW